MDRLEELRTFVAVADLASFAEAARQMRISPTAASRAVASLEASLGTALLRRTTRSVRLTEEGAAYLERCRAALVELDDAALSLRGDGATPGGTLVITAPVTFGRLHILPLVNHLLRAHPALLCAYHDALYAHRGLYFCRCDLYSDLDLNLYRDLYY